MEKPLLSSWSLEGGEQGLGDRNLLDQPLTAFFSSRQCPGTAIRAAMAWAIEQAGNRNPVISGFHSPLEQSVLKVLLTANAPCVMVAGRHIQQARIPKTWVGALRGETAALVIMERTTRRLTTELGFRRNSWIARHASRIVIAHASLDGHLKKQAQKWEQEGLLVDYLT